MESVFAADAALFAWAQRLPHPPWLNALMIGASLAGLSGAIWIAIGIGWGIRHREAMGVWRLGLSLLLAGVLVDGVLKPTFGRDRPFVAAPETRVLGVRPDTSSLPSGHAASSAAGAYALSRIWPAAAVPVWALAALIASSRVYLGVHYPLDVAAGLLLGLGCAYFVTGGLVYRFDRPTTSPSRRREN